MSSLAPAVIPSPQSVADKPICTMQHGDVAVVLTSSRLDRLIFMCENSWITQADFDLYQELKNLRDQSR